MTAASHCRSRLSALVVVHEDESHLAGSLDSVRSVADEVLVLDLSTAKRASSSQATVYHGSADDAAAARNQALEYAAGDWLLSLEAGEALHPASAASMRAWLATEPARDAVHFCWLDLPPSAADAEGEQVAVPRLLPKRPGLKYTGRVRETVLPAVEALQLRMEINEWRISAAASPDEPAQIERLAKRQLRLAALDAQQHGMSPRGLIASAESYASLGDRGRATQHYYQALRLADRGSLEMLIAYYGLLGLFGCEEADRRQQLAVCLEALETFPFDAQLLCAMGAYLQQQDHLELACRSFQAAFEIGQVEPRAPHPRDLPALGALSWSLIMQLRGEHDRALQVLEQAWRRFPQARSLARRRLELLVQLGREADALSAAASVAGPEARVEPLRIGIRGACLAAQGNWISALGYLRAAQEAGCDDPICLRWLTVGLLALGDTQAVRPILQAWRGVAPSDVEARRYEEELDKLAPAAAPPRKAKNRATRVDSPVAPSDSAPSFATAPLGHAASTTPGA